jgi:hypothetical protein
LGERVALGPQLPTRQLSQRPRIGLAASRPSRRWRISRAAEPAHVGDHRSELAIGVLQHRLQPVGQPRPLIDEVDAIAGQVTQVALRGGRNEARAQQSVAQQVRQPLGILNVGLAA